MDILRSAWALRSKEAEIQVRWWVSNKGVRLNDTGLFYRAVIPWNSWVQSHT